MLNTRALTYPSPADANLRPQSDGLLMLREGGNDLTRFYYYKGLPKHKMSNRKTIVSMGGYNNGNVTSATTKGGIVPFPPMAQQQSTGNQVSNDPVPVLNALVDWRINPKMNKLIDAPLPPQINPLALQKPIHVA